VQLVAEQKQKEEGQSRQKSRYDAKILLVDDDLFCCTFIEGVLRSHGYGAVTVVNDGEAAIEATKKICPDIVLIDIVMPKVDGLEYCRWVRGIPEFERLPVIVQTAITRADYIKHAFDAGATDFIRKPVDVNELLSRTSIHIENQMLMRDLIQYQQRIHSELDKACETQRLIMPSEEVQQAITKKYNIDIAAHFQPSSELGGDFWGVENIDDDKMVLFNVDFSGHGVTAALNTFRLHTILKEANLQDKTAGEILMMLNSKICALLEVGAFATMFLAIIDRTSPVLLYASAGAPAALIISPDGNSNILDNAGIPLGVVEDAEYTDCRAAFHPDDVLITYSDALIETEDKSGMFLSEEAVCSCVTDTLHAMQYNKGENRHAVIVLDQLRKLLRVHKGEMPVEDDLTIAVFHRRP